jgi:hypothetical protein
MGALLAAAATGDPGAVARLILLALGASVVAALLQPALRQAIWALWHLAATLFAFLSRVLLTFVCFLNRLIAEAIEGLAEEGQSANGTQRQRPWVGWLMIGPLVYCALMLTFMASDLTVAILIFEAMGLTLGQTARSTMPIPLDAAMGVVFVALAVFWGIVFFDVLGVTPFRYIWQPLSATQRKRLSRVVAACLGVTLLAGMTMGLWSQAQLRGGMPEPWQTVLPWFIRGSLVALLICATAISGKPFGSALTAALVLLLLVVRALTYLALVLLRLIVALLRESVKVVLAVVALVALAGDRAWNWLASFEWAQRMHLRAIALPELEAVGGEVQMPERFAG